MSNAKYIGFDFETGGLDPEKNPILTGYFCALDKDLNILGDLELSILPDSPYAEVDKDALKVNKIDLEKHMAQAITRAEASARLGEFLTKFGGKNKKDKNRPRPLGHNVAFDLGFLPQLISKGSIEERLHYGNICTKVLTDFFKEVGVLPEDVGNLESLVRYFNIPKLNAHTAKDDTLMMVGVYGKMIQMIKSSTGGSSLSVDILSMLEK
jgi:DNA polymerase III epsilon subunit-like protein